MSMLVNLPAGMIVDTIGKRNLLMAVAMAWTGIPYLIIATTSHYGLILLAMALVGIGNFLWPPAAITSISEMYPQRPIHEYVDGLRVLARNTSQLILALVTGVRSLTQHGLTTFLPLYLVNELRLSAVVLGVYLTVVQASGMIATPIAGTLSDRIGPKRVATAGMFTSSLIVLGFAAIDLGSTFVAALALLGFFVYSMRPALFRWAIGVVPRQYEGTTVGALFTPQALFSTLMPLVGGALADHYGLLSVFYFIAGTILVANVAIFAVPDLRRPAAAAVPQEAT